MHGTLVEIEMKGLDERPLASADYAIAAVNVQFDHEGFWSPAWGARSALNLGGGIGIFSSIHWFQPFPNRRWLLVERRTSAEFSTLSYVDWTTSTLVDISSRRRLESHDQGLQFLDLDRWTYILSPTGPLSRWNGYREEPVGFAGPAPAPRAVGPKDGFNFQDKAGGTYGGGGFNLAVENRGVGPYVTSGSPEWLYGYVITILNELGQESPPSRVAFAAGISDALGRRMVRLQIPQLPANAVAFRLWRTKRLHPDVEAAAFANLYFHSQWPCAHQCDIIDHTPDNELTDILDPTEMGPTPAGARAIASWQGHLWLGGPNGEETTLVYSNPAFREQFPETNYLRIGTAKTGPITALLPVGRVLLVFKTGGVYAVKGSPASGYTVTVLTEAKGAEAPRSVTIVPELNGVFFVDVSGPQIITGTLEDDSTTVVQPLVGGISKLWQRTVGYNVQAAHAVYDPTRNEVWLQVPEGGNVHTRLGLVFHPLLGTWSTRPDWDAGCFEFALGRLWIGSNNTNREGVYFVTAASRTTLDSSFEGRYQTRPLRERRQWSAHRLEITGEAMGGDLTVKTRSDKQPLPLFTQQEDQAIRQIHPDHDLDKWGAGTWDAAARWGDYDLTVYSTPLALDNALEHEIRVRGSRFKIAQLALLTNLEGGKFGRQRQGRNRSDA